MARSRRSKRSTNRTGIERAMQHIKEAQELTRELGGTDVDVKEYFFSLNAVQLQNVLNAYEKQYGSAAREYAEVTIPAWRSGRVKMSGQNASRLFHLLPRFMPLERKYALIESLWNRHAPRSEYSISFGRNADEQAISDAVTKHVLTIVDEHNVPENIQHRFTWLSDGDSQVMQQMLNYYLMRDRMQAIDLSKEIIRMILPLVISGGTIHNFRRELKIGGHQIHVFFDPLVTEVRINAGSPNYLAMSTIMNNIWIIFVIALFIFTLIWIFSGHSTSSNSQSSSPPHNKKR